MSDKNFVKKYLEDFSLLMKPSEEILDIIITNNEQLILTS